MSWDFKVLGATSGQEMEVDTRPARRKARRQQPGVRVDDRKNMKTACALLGLTLALASAGQKSL